MPDPVVPAPAPAADPAPAAVAPAAAAAAVPAAAPAPTLAADPNAVSPPAPAPVAKAGELPQGFDFRAYLAAGDKDVLKDLEKYTDLRAPYKTLRELQAKISKGELKAAPQPLPANATEEQKAEWRKANGVPEKAEQFVEKLALPEGVVLGENDKPLVGEFAKFAHEKGWTQDRFNEAMNFYYQAQDLAEAKVLEADGGHKQSAMQALMEEWGPADYKANMNAVGALNALMGEDAMAMVLGARTADGRLIGNTAEWNKLAARIMREINPAAAIVPAGADSSVKTINDEIAKIEETFRKAVGGDAEAHRTYYGTGGNPGQEVRYRELIGARDKMTARGKAA